MSLPTSPISRARLAYAREAENLAVVLRLLDQTGSELGGQGRRKAEQALERARVRYETAVLALAEAEEPIYRPDDPLCSHVLVLVGRSVFECKRCGRIGDWRDGQIVWRREDRAPAPAEASP